MPPPNPQLQALVTKALHNLKNRNKAIDKVAATPGANRAEVTMLVEETMARNRRHARIAGAVLIAFGVGVGVLVWLVMIWTDRLFYVIAIAAPFFVLMGLAKLVVPSPYINADMEKAEKG
jgi:hypothetical protein